MTDAKRQLVRNWLTKAQRDFGTARKAGAEPEPYFDTGIYHCQPAVEKALKGFLAFHDQPLEKTHDLRLLVTQATIFEKGFAEWMATAIELTPYATAYRYPSELFEPKPAEFEQALALTEQFITFVLQQIPTDYHPGSSENEKQ